MQQQFFDLLIHLRGDAALTGAGIFQLAGSTFSLFRFINKFHQSPGSITKNSNPDHDAGEHIIISS
jgi:hypothetical protein